MDPLAPPLLSRMGPWLRRTALGLLALFAVIVVVRVVGVYRQRAAREAIASTGWTVIYGDPQAAAQSTFLQRLLSRVDSGGRLSGFLSAVEPEVISVTISERVGGADEQDLTLLQRLPRLESLAIFRSELTDEDLLVVGGLNALRELSIASDQLNDERLVHLARLTQLKSVWIDSERVTDQGLTVLSNMRDLESLDVQSTRVSGIGLDALPRPTNLRLLRLGAAADDDGLVAAARLEQLQELSVVSRRVTDRGVAALRSLGRLEQLAIAGHPNVTDAGLAELAHLRSLQACAVESHRVTFEGASQLQTLPILADLELRGGALNDDGLSRFTPPASLQMLRLYHTSTSEDALDAFEAAHPGIRLWR